MEEEEARIEEEERKKVNYDNQIAMPAAKQFLEMAKR